MSIIGGIIILLIGIYIFQELGFYDDEDKLMYCICGMVFIGGWVYNLLLKKSKITIEYLF